MLGPTWTGLEGDEAEVVGGGGTKNGRHIGGQSRANQLILSRKCLPPQKKKNVPEKKRGTIFFNRKFYGLQASFFRGFLL